MAFLDGVNYTNSEVSQPSEKIAPGDQFGRIRVAYDEFTFSAEASSGDQIRMMEIPKGARVHGAVISCDGALGGTCDLELGNLASSDGSEPANSDSLVDLCNCDAAAAFSSMDAGISGSPTSPVPGMMKEYSEAVRVVATLTANTASATGKKVTAAVYYSLD